MTAGLRRADAVAAGLGLTSPAAVAPTLAALARVVMPEADGQVRPEVVVR